MDVKLLKMVEVYKILPSGRITYDFLLWAGCKIKLGEKLHKKKRIEKVGPTKDAKKDIGPKKVFVVTFRQQDYFVAVGDIQGAYKEIPK